MFSNSLLQNGGTKVQGVLRHLLFTSTRQNQTKKAISSIETMFCSWTC
jgi:hypothetical protein